jgi:hypothetical protein
LSYFHLHPRLTKLPVQAKGARLYMHHTAPIHFPSIGPLRLYWEELPCGTSAHPFLRVCHNLTHRRLKYQYTSEVESDKYFRASNPG